MVHASLINETDGSKLDSNKRLEFLGDAVLGLVVSTWLYAREPDADEGLLTRMRSSLVRRSALARAARDMDLGKFLIMGRGEEQAGGRDRDVNLANAVESVIGAVFLDQGANAAESLVRRLLTPLIEEWGPEQEHIDYKSRLQEHVQAEQKVQPKYAIINEEGPDHDRTFDVDVRAGDTLLGQGRGKSKRDAEKDAARNALDQLKQA